MTDNDKRIGSILNDRYELVRVVGSGGMGVVYAAVDRHMDRQVAVKFLAAPSPQALKRFERECQVLASVESVLTPKIFAWGVSDNGAVYLVMELVPGQTLQALLDEKGTLPVELVRTVAIQICQALGAVHARGIVHRDIKPSNVMLLADGTTTTMKLMDFGVARLVDSGGDQKLTKTNQFVGSLGYMSPEHLAPQLLDARSDIFSLGCVLYRALSGRLPYEAQDALDGMIKMQSGQKDPLPDTVPAYMKQIVDACLAVQPKLRFQNAAAVERALRMQAVSQSMPRYLGTISHRRLTFAMLGVVLVSTALVLGVQAVIRQNSLPTPSPGRLHLLAQLSDSDKDWQAVELVLAAYKSQPKEFWQKQNEQVGNDLAYLANSALNAHRFDLAELAWQGSDDAIRYSEREADKRCVYLVTKALHQLMCGYPVDKVLASAQKALKMAREINRPDWEIDAMLTTAGALAKQEKYDESLRWYGDALKLIRTLPDQPGYRAREAQVCRAKYRMLGQLHRGPQQLVQELQPMADSIALCQEHDPGRISLNEIMELLQDSVSLPASMQSKDLLAKEYKIASQVNLSVLHPQYRQFEVYRAVIAARCHKPGAMQYLQKLMRSEENMPNAPWYQLLASAWLDTIDDSGMDKQLPALEHVYDKLKNVPGCDAGALAVVAFHIGRTSADSGHRKKALAYFRTAIAHTGKPRPADPAGSQMPKFCVLSGICDHALKLGEIDLARECMSRLDRIDKTQLDREQLRILQQLKTRLAPKH